MIEIFKTNVPCVETSSVLVDELIQHFPGSTINFDLDDCDKILRVSGSYINCKKITDVMNSKGFICELLE